MESLRTETAELRASTAQDRLIDQGEPVLRALLVRLVAAEQAGSRLVAAKTDARRAAQRGWFQVNGKITSRDAGSVSIWGRALPTNSELAQLGTHVDEANIVVMSPDPAGLSSGSHYVGFQSYARESTGRNALGGTVPVSIYGPKAQSSGGADDELQKELGELQVLQQDLASQITRTRRTLVAKKIAAPADQPFDQAAAEAFVSKLFETQIEESSYLRAGGSMPWERWLPSRRELPMAAKNQSMMSGVFPEHGSIVQLDYTTIASVARVHAWKLLREYLRPERREFLGDVVDQSLPSGQESLLNLLTNEKLMASSPLSQRFGFKLQQSRHLPELILVEVFPHGYSKIATASLLCLWTGRHTTVLASTLGSTATSGFVLDLREASRDPLAADQ